MNEVDFHVAMKLNLDSDGLPRWRTLSRVRVVDRVRLVSFGQLVTYLNLTWSILVGSIYWR